MEGNTSTSNEGSQKRDLNKYKELNTKKVNEKEIRERMAATYPRFDLNCIACDVKDNVKTAQDSNPVSASSADTFIYDQEIFLDPKYSITWTNLNLITPEKEEKISRRRKKEQAKRKAAKEAREAAEAQEIESKNRIEEVNNEK